MSMVATERLGRVTGWVAASGQKSAIGGQAIWQAATRVKLEQASKGLEGIIAKRIDSRYESGDRTGAWVKFRVNKGQELVIGGYRMGKDSFDNLAVGYYDQG